METICIFVDVPVCSFRPNWSRDYQDSYAFPPPSTTFGMLLSLTGVDWSKKKDFSGVDMALAIEGQPDHARVFRKFRRVAQAQESKSKGKISEDYPYIARRPDYQELLLGLKLWIWLRDGGANNSLVKRVEMALNPARRSEIRRYGGLSLGESSHLVDFISIKTPTGEGRFLSQDSEGYYSFPVWVNHPRDEGNWKSNLPRFIISEPLRLEEPPPKDPRWIRIGP